MPFVPVPGDLAQVKSKLFLGLTKRQIFCFAPAVVLGGGAYYFSRSAIGNDFALMLMLLIALPLFAFGVYEKDGRPLEKVLLDVIRVKFLFPSIRPYRTHNYYQEVDDLVRKDREAKRNPSEKQARKKGKTDKGGSKKYKQKGNSGQPKHKREAKEKP